MSEVRKLDIVKAEPVEDDIRKGVIAILERTLEEAKRGEVCEIVVIGLMNDGDWIERTTPTVNYTSWIGRLEITKHHWIKSSDERNGEYE